MSFATQTWWQLFGIAGAPFRLIILIMYLANFDDWFHWVNPILGRNRVDAPLPAHLLIKSIGTPWCRQFSTRINGVTISQWMNDGQEGLMTSLFLPVGFIPLFSHHPIVTCHQVQLSTYQCPIIILWLSDACPTILRWFTPMVTIFPAPNPWHQVLAQPDAPSHDGAGRLR